MSQSLFGINDPYESDDESDSAGSLLGLEDCLSTMGLSNLGKRVFVTILKCPGRNASNFVCVSSSAHVSKTNPFMQYSHDNRLPSEVKKMLRNGSIIKILLGADRQFNNEMMDALKISETSSVQLAALTRICGFEPVPGSMEFMRRAPMALKHQFQSMGHKNFDGIFMPSDNSAIELAVLWHNICLYVFLDLVEGEQPNILPFDSIEEKQISKYFMK